MKKRSVSKAAAVLLTVLLLCSVGTTAFAADALGAGSAVAAGAAGDAPAEEGAALPTPDSEPEASGSTDESEASPSAEPSVMPSAEPETETGEDDAAPTPSAAPENGGLTASPDTLAAPIADEGFTWDAETKTLTITAGTGDYTTSTVSSRPYDDYKSQATKIVVDGNADTVIGSYAFYQFNNVEELEIKQCGDIKNYAFNFCSKLRTVNITACGNIGDRAFGQTRALETVTIGTCGDFDVYVFQNASKLRTLKIGTCGSFHKDTFQGARNLESVEIDRCGDIGNSAFSGQTKLTTVVLGECGNIGDKAFSGCSALTGDIILNCGDIGKNVFNSCANVASLTIEKCGDIGSSAFLGLKGITKVVIKECGDIGANAFGNMAAMTPGADACESLESIYIGKCGNIGSQAFCYLKQLNAVEIDECVSVGKMAFWNSGAPIQKLELGDCTIKEDAFYFAKIDEVVLKENTVVESYAFKDATIKSLTLSNVTSVGEAAFEGVDELEVLNIENLERIEEGTFKIYDGRVSAVETINLSNVEYIGHYAFKGFANLKTVNIEGNCGYIGAHAFSGCENLKKIDIADETRLGYSDSFVNQQYVHDRVAAILAGSFALIDTTPAIDEILPEGWTSVKTGGQNSTASVGDTQLTKEAKWADAEATVADVLIKAYYSVNQQMDFVFVADCSNSMSGFGSADAMNSNFYNMQSKLMDVTETLLNAEDLDTRVAFTTFGEEESSVSKFFQKGQTAEAESYIWNDIVNYYSNTNYSHGLAEALELVKENKAAGRNTTVIFISDGQPYYDGTTVPEEYYGAAEADAIRAEGVQIISVLQQVPESELASSQANMEKIADKVFSSTDLDGFSTAMNGAIDCAYTTYTLTDTVDPAFALDADSIEASAGDVAVSEDENGNTVLTWTITNAPFEEHTLSFKENLKPDDKGIRPTGSLDTNEGDAVLYAGSTPVNAVETPVLPRGTSMTVEKVWKNDTADVRPDSVEVTLLRDGEAFETVELTEQGGWKYTWPALDPAYTWSVGETSVPEGYQSAVSGSGAAWTITNTYTVVATPTPAPTATPAPTPEVTPAPTATPAPEATPTAAPEVTPSPAPEKPAVDTPKTGDDTNPFIWFSVMLAAAGSMTAVLAVRRRGKRARHGR